MKFCQMHVSLALLALLGLATLSAASQPDLDLRHRRLIQRARSLSASQQEWSKRAVEDILSQLSMPEPEPEARQESEAQQESEARQESPVAREEDLHVELERSVDSPNLPPRERKAGCKNFYWKGFTSC